MMKCWLVMALLPFAAQAQQADFARQWPLQLSQDDAGAYRVALDASVYAATHRRDLGDVRVLDADGKQVASAVYAAAAPAAATPRIVELTWFALPTAQGTASDDLSVVVQRDAEGKVVSIRNAVAGNTASGAADPAWLVDAGDNAGKLRTLQVDWADADATFDLGYRLEGSDDLRDWQVLDARVRLVQLHNEGRALRSNQVNVETTKRYLRLLPLQRSGAPALRGLRGEIAVASEAGDWQWQAAQANGGNAKDGWLYRVPGRFPAQRLEVAMPPNSTATWRVSSRDDDSAIASSGPAWQLRAADWNAWSLSEAGKQQQSSPLQLDTLTSDREWRLQAGAGASPAEAPALRIGYRPGSVVFLAQGRAPYLLVAGSANVEGERAALEPMLDALRNRNGARWQPAAAALGEGSERAGDAAYQPAKPPRDWKSLVLWVVLALGALIVAGFAFSLLRGKPSQP
ncbi:MAG: DUF3999 domain-containing protein [Pseudoxanthomonas sp.]